MKTNPVKPRELPPEYLEKVKQTKPPTDPLAELEGLRQRVAQRNEEFIRQGDKNGMGGDWV